MIASSTEVVGNTKSYLLSLLLHEHPSLKESCLSYIHSFTKITDSSFVVAIIEECERHQDHCLISQVLENPSIQAIDVLSDLILSKPLRASQVVVDGLSSLFSSFM